MVEVKEVMVVMIAVFLGFTSLSLVYKKSNVLGY